MADRNQGHPDRRAGPRTEVLLKVEYHDPEGLKFDYLSNLGAGGLFIHTHTPFDPGRRLAFSVSFPGLLEPIELAGVVRWRRPARPETADPPGVGVEFVFEHARQREGVQRLLRLVHGQAPLEGSPDRAFRVLLVEDNDFVQELFQHALRRFAKHRNAPELEVVAASDAVGALKSIEGESFDLAIVDHYLPTMTGARLVHKLRDEAGLVQLPILMVSVGGDEIRDEAIAAGADGYLSKPVLLKQLVETLGRLAPYRASYAPPRAP
jgi:uncharacterized protein (TIGR02266 family)